MRMQMRARCIVLLLASLLALHCMATLPRPALAQSDEADAGATDATWVLLRPRVSLPPGHDATTDAGIGPEGLPRARCDASLVGVAASGATAGPHALLYGGLQVAGPLGDLWSLDLSTPTDPLWTFIPPVAGAAAPFVRAGAATEFLPDFGSVLLFGGIGVNYENNIHALDVSTGAWRMVEASTADGLSSTGPFARAFMGWKRTADAAQPNEAGDLTYELVLYGGAGDSAGQNTPYDKDQADLWSYFYSRNGTAAPGAANEFYGSWLARDPLVCVEYSEVCTDAQSVGQRFATVEESVQSSLHCNRTAPRVVLHCTAPNALVPRLNSRPVMCAVFLFVQRSDDPGQRSFSGQLPSLDAGGPADVAAQRGRGARRGGGGLHLVLRVPAARAEERHGRVRRRLSPRGSPRAARRRDGAPAPPGGAQGQSV